MKISNENGFVYLHERQYVYTNAQLGEALEICVAKEALETRKRNKRFKNHSKTNELIFRSNKMTETFSHMHSTNKEIRMYKVRLSDSCNNNRYCIPHQTEYSLF